MSASAGTILWIPEAVTLAHVARPIAALRAISHTGWKSVVACDESGLPFLGGLESRHVPLRSISSQRFLKALRRGTPLYDAATLRQYVADDLEVIRSVRPDLVVGDFRLSLAISARIAKVPYATLTSAYWSPYYDPERWPVPELPLTRALPMAVAGPIFRGIRPAAFALHAAAFNRVRREHGLPSLPKDLRRVYTDADWVLYTDVPELFPMAGLPPNHRFLGPVLWQPEVPMPDLAGPGKKTVYVNLGTSGPVHLLQAIVRALATRDIQLVVGTASRVRLESSHHNVCVAGVLPGIDVARRSDLVICNGGSLTSYQALSAGVPVIGIASNLDQFLNMQAIERAGAGKLLRADRLRPDSLARTVDEALASPSLQTRAGSMADDCHRHSFHQGIRDFLSEVVANVASARAAADRAQVL